MHLVRFHAEGIHGFLKFNIKFNAGLTFLTGINGSGKTSAINAMVALITPDLSMIADLIFKSIVLEVENEGKALRIEAMSDGQFVHLITSGTDEIFTFARYNGDPAYPSIRPTDGEVEFYRDLILNKASHPVLQAIAKLPTPMFLGLDRRAAFDDDTLRRARYPNRVPRAGRNVFSKSLSASLAVATGLAQDRYRDALIQSGRIAERLQREMLLSLLTASPTEKSFGSLTVPTIQDLQEIASVRSDLDAIAEIMRLPPADLKRRVLPLLDMLVESADQIPPHATLEQIFASENDNSPVISAVFRWSTNQTHLKRIRQLSATVAQYNTMKVRSLHSTASYRELVNDFLGDSGKSIEFSEDGSLHVKIEGVKDTKHISYLSSGEAQIFVILTHLAFHPLAKKDNVFIIDEPELSLHVQWQEKFVDSIITANANIQYILATHSPSIILERVDDCIDISRKVKRTTSRGRQ